MSVNSPEIHGNHLQNNGKVTTSTPIIYNKITTTAPLTPVAHFALLMPLISSQTDITKSAIPTGTNTTLEPRLTSSHASISRSSSQQNIETDSGKSSSCSPALLDYSYDSGITEEITDMQVHKRIQQCKQILVALERKKEAYKKLRERLSTIVDRKNKKISDEEQNCIVCKAEINLEDPKSSAICCICKESICNGVKCAKWIPNTGQWECAFCQSSDKQSLAQTSLWVTSHMSLNQQKMHARSEIFIPISDCNDNSMQFESVSQVGINSVDITQDQKLKIREYVQQVVSDLLGQSLNQMGKLSKSENHLPAIIPNAVQQINNNNSDEYFTGISESRLRQLIQNIIAETIRASGLNSSSATSEIALNTHTLSDNLPLDNCNIKNRHRTEYYFESQNYQEYLANTVLNTIANNQGNGLFSESTPEIVVARAIDDENQSTTSGSSSAEPRSDCSLTDAEQQSQFINKGDDLPPSGSQQKRIENIASIDRESAFNNYIASHTVPMPDFSTHASESEDDTFGSVTSSAIGGEVTWGDNWLLKKKFCTANSAGIVVPSPKEDVRCQIGDKVADEVSDLSEFGSDTDDSTSNLLLKNVDPFNDRILNRHLIGGQNTKTVLDELVDNASMVSKTSNPESEALYTETRNDHAIQNIIKNEAINNCVAQAYLSNDEIKCFPLSPQPENIEQDGNTLTTGSIAEREYKKWHNAIDMPNNPYAPEALKKRIDGSQDRFLDLPNISPSTERNPIELKNIADEEEHLVLELDKKRYSRDYYINDNGIHCQNISTRSIPTSPNPTHTTNFTDEPSVDAIIIKETNTIQKTALDMDDIYQATPAKVVQEQVSLETLSNQSLQSVNITTFDNSDSVRIYDFNKQETLPEKNSKPIDEIESENTTQSGKESKSKHSMEIPKRERPTELAIGGGCLSSSVLTPYSTSSRGSTPTAFKFLQPKRKLIEPSQVLSFDEDIMPTTSSSKSITEEQVLHAMPSVKALAQAFLLTSNKTTEIQKRWTAKVRTPTAESSKLSASAAKSPKLESASSCPLTAIATELSSAVTETEVLENVVTASDRDFVNAPIEAEYIEEDLGVCPEPKRGNALKNNIAFFENLKFK